MQSDPRVFYGLSAVAALVAVAVGIFFEFSFYSGLAVGISGTVALGLLLVGVITSRLQDQAEELTSQMNAILGDGDIDLGALLSGAGFGALLGGEPEIVEPAPEDPRKDDEPNLA